MASIVSDFLTFLGITEFPPVLFGDFLLWFIKLMLGVCIVAYILKVFAGFANGIFHTGRWVK